MTNPKVNIVTNVISILIGLVTGELLVFELEVEDFIDVT
jgi:hypothetical protein